VKHPYAKKKKKKKKKPNCSQIQIKNLECPSIAPTIGGETEGALCRTTITSHSIPILRLAAKVISSNTRASVFFFFSSNARALASNKAIWGKKKKSFLFFGNEFSFSDYYLKHLFEKIK